MKVFFAPAPAPASALDLWLREAGTEAQTDAQTDAHTDVHGDARSDAQSDGHRAPATARTGWTEPFAVTPPEAHAQPRDRAEELLDLDIWNGAAPAARSLTATAGPRYALAGEAPAMAAQGWAEHIFESLSLKSPPS